MSFGVRGRAAAVATVVLVAAGILFAGASVSWPVFQMAVGRGVLKLSPATVAAQNPNTMAPAQSAARAREVIHRAIQALGGTAYLNVKDITREGRLAEFGSADQLEGFTRIWDYTILPDKNRTEYFKQRNIIQVFNGDKGWVMDRAGVEEAQAVSLERFQESLKKDIDILMRFRMNEDGLIFRYGGSDLLDLKQVEWVEVIDRERRQFRIAFEKSTALPIRAVYISRDPETRERIEEVEYLSNYQNVQGIMTPLQVWRNRNGRKVYQAFFENYQYNTSLAEALFTRASLDEAFAKGNKKKKK
jgi:hypothetical protein